MQAIQITEYVQGPSSLHPITLPLPRPKQNEYLIRIHASAANFFDLLQIRGKYQHQPPFPWISGAEFSGVVLSAPHRAAFQAPPRFKPGDRIFGAHQGAYATHICVPDAALRPIPAGWSFEDAAGLMVTAPTAYAGLVTRSGIKAGDVVLVHAAAGGVGLAAVQVAKAFGATVIAAASSARKLEVAKRFGADSVVDYSREGWEEEVMGLTPAGRGVDIVFDPVGMIQGSMKCVAWNGRIVVVGFAAGKIEKVAMNRVLLKNISLVGLHWGRYKDEQPEVMEEVWKGLGRLIEGGKFKGTCFDDKKFVGLEAVGEALELLGRRATWGKVVVSLPVEKDSKL